MNNLTFRKIITRFCQLPLLLVMVLILGLINLGIPGSTSKDALLFMRLVAATMFVCYLIGTFIKRLYYKDRPEPMTHKNVFQKINASTFPSVHTAQATVILCAAFFMAHAYYLLGTASHILIAVLIALCTVVFYILIALSRVILRKHFFVDVVFGTALGFVAVSFAVLHYRAIIGILELFFRI